MTEKLYQDFGKQIEELTLVSSSGGAYEVDVDGTLVYSKFATKRHATYPEVRDAIRAM